MDTVFALQVGLHPVWLGPNSPKDLVRNNIPKFRGILWIYRRDSCVNSYFLCLTFFLLIFHLCTRSNTYIFTAFVWKLLWLGTVCNRSIPQQICPPHFQAQHWLLQNWLQFWLCKNTALAIEGSSVYNYTHASAACHTKHTHTNKKHSLPFHELRFGTRN